MAFIEHVPQKRKKQKIDYNKYYKLIELKKYAKVNNDELLISLAANGDEKASEIIYLSCKKFIHNFVSKNYVKLFDCNYDDYISVGSIAFIKALKTFDINKGYKFLSYFSMVLDNEIKMYFRRNKKHFNVHSLNEVIAKGERKDNYKDFECFIDSGVSVENEVFSNMVKDDIDIIIYMVLESLTKNNYKQKIIFLEHLMNVKQNEIKMLVMFSQSYVSRVIKNIKNVMLQQVLFKFNKLKSHEKTKYLDDINRFVFLEHKQMSKDIISIIWTSRNINISLSNLIDKLNSKGYNVNLSDFKKLYIISKLRFYIATRYFKYELVTRKRITNSSRKR